MAVEQPVLSNIYQVFSSELLDDLDKRGRSKASDFHWGEDRTISLRTRDTSVKVQWNGTCSSFATIAAMENKLGGTVELSERSLWDEYGVFSTKEAIETAKVHYVLEEKYWPHHQRTLDPRSKGKGRYKIIQADYLANEYGMVVKAIDSGNPCVVALSTPVDLIKGKQQVEASSKFKKKSGHAICVSGYKVEKGKGYFLVKNSWGISNGDNGYQYIAFQLFDQGGYVSFWEIKEILDRGEQISNFF